MECYCFDRDRPTYTGIGACLGSFEIEQCGFQDNFTKCPYYKPRFNPPLQFSRLDWVLVEGALRVQANAAEELLRRNGHNDELYDMFVDTKELLRKVQDYMKKEDIL